MLWITWMMDINIFIQSLHSMNVITGGLSNACCLMGICDIHSKIFYQNVIFRNKCLRMSQMGIYFYPGLKQAVSSGCELVSVLNM